MPGITRDELASRATRRKPGNSSENGERQWQRVLVRNAIGPKVRPEELQKTYGPAGVQVRVGSDEDV